MTRPQKLIINVETGEEQYLDLTDEEMIQMEKDKIEQEQLQAEREAEAARVSALKESAKAKLIAGQALTNDEASVLVI